MAASAQHHPMLMCTEACPTSLAGRPHSVCTLLAQVIARVLWQVRGPRPLGLAGRAHLTVRLPLAPNAHRMWHTHGMAHVGVGSVPRLGLGHLMMAKTRRQKRC